MSAESRHMTIDPEAAVQAIADAFCDRDRHLPQDVARDDAAIVLDEIRRQNKGLPAARIEHRNRARQEAAEYRHIGDLMQSEASRLAEWAQKTWDEGGTQIEMPYEVQMAIIGLRSAVEDWTHARIGYATDRP